MRRLILAITIALCGLALIAGAVEWHWRQRGYVPGILDGQDLWAQQRQRVYPADDHKALVLLGASRTLYSLDLQRIRERLPDYAPVMLALDAMPAMATLRDLSVDPDFRGIVVCDIDGIGLWKITWESQQAWVDHYRRQWTPSRDLHRSMLNHWQQHAVIARSDFSLLRSLVRTLRHEPEPFHPHMQMSSAREGSIDYEGVDTSQHRRDLEAHLAKYNGKFPGPDPAAWHTDLAEAKVWVEKIRRRGGSVIFYSSPISGLRRRVEEDTYPRAQFWDQLAESTGAHTLHADDVPALKAIPLPDESHVDYRNKRAYTDALIDALIARGLL